MASWCLGQAQRRGRSRGFGAWAKAARRWRHERQGAAWANGAASFAASSSQRRCRRQSFGAWAATARRERIFAGRCALARDASRQRTRAALVRGLGRWKDAAREDRLVMMLLSALGRQPQTRATLLRAVLQWRQLLQASDATRQAALRMRRRVAIAAYQRAWAAWQRARSDVAVQAAATRAVRLWSLQHVGLGFRSWAAAVHEAAEQRAMMARVLGRLMDAQRFACWSAWYELALTRQQRLQALRVVRAHLPASHRHLPCSFLHLRSISPPSPLHLPAAPCIDHASPIHLLFLAPSYRPDLSSISTRPR